MRPLTKQNFLTNALLKLTDRNRYLHYKRLLEVQRCRNRFSKVDRSRLPHMEDPRFFTEANFVNIAQERGVISFKHSGSSGDLIYALPTLKKIKALTGAKIRLTLNLNAPIHFVNGWKHPYGNVMLNDRSPDWLRPLILTQGYVDELLSIQNGEPFYGDVDLDWFRVLPVNTGAGHIGRWYIPITSVYPDVINPWLQVEPMPNLDNTVLVARTSRARNRSIHFRVLAKYPNVGFIGLDPEFEAIKSDIPHIKRISISNFLEMAQAIAGARLFIANQSLPYSIAEALKCRRLLEYCKECPNNIPLGGEGYDFYSQAQFASILNTLMD